MAIPRPHTATPLIYLKTGERIQGEFDVATERATPFGCFLFLPRGSEDTASPRGRRNVKRPTLLTNPRDLAGDVLSYLRAEDELEIVALNLTGPDPVRWQIVGTPEYLSAPRRLKGFEFTLRRVED